MPQLSPLLWGFSVFMVIFPFVLSLWVLGSGNTSMGGEGKSGGYKVMEW